MRDEGARGGDAPVVEALDRAWRRSRVTLRGRLARLRSRAFLLLQSAVAAGVAWFVAHDVLGHATPFFAPIVAIVCLGMSYGQRVRRVLEVAVGVAVGVFTADVFVHLAGSGPWQITVVVLVSMGLALLLDGGQLLVTQAAVQSVVVVALAASPGQALSRWTDALVGGAVALVAAVVVPQAPLRRPRVAASGAVAKISELLRQAASVAGEGDVEEAARVLASARATESLLRELRQAADEGLAVITSSPLSRRRHAPRVRSMAELVEPLDIAMRSTRVLVRRVTVSVGRGEHLPESYRQLLGELADATDVMARALSENAAASAGLLALKRVAARTGDLPRTTSLATETVLAQLRSLVVDLLQVAGLDVDEAHDLLPPERGRD